MLAGSTQFTGGAGFLRIDGKVYQVSRSQIDHFKREQLKRNPTLQTVQGMQASIEKIQSEDREIESGQDPSSSPSLKGLCVTFANFANSHKRQVALAVSAIFLAVIGAVCRELVRPIASLGLGLSLGALASFWIAGNALLKIQEEMRVTIQNDSALLQVLEDEVKNSFPSSKTG